MLLWRERGEVSSPTCGGAWWCDPTGEAVTGTVSCIMGSVGSIPNRLYCVWKPHRDDVSPTTVQPSSDVTKTRVNPTKFPTEWLTECLSGAESDHTGVQTAVHPLQVWICVWSRSTAASTSARVLPAPSTASVWPDTLWTMTARPAQVTCSRVNLNSSISTGVTESKDALSLVAVGSCCSSRTPLLLRGTVSVAHCVTVAHTSSNRAGAQEVHRAPLDSSRRVFFWQLILSEVKWLWSHCK